MKSLKSLKGRVAGVVVCGSLLWAAAPAGAVVGGQPVPSGQFRYVANVEILGMPECSGVLLGPSWVLTAGHCASVSGALSEGLVPTPVAIPASAYTVFLGTPKTDGSGGERHAVSEVVVDPRFLISNGDGNDVALLRLSTPSEQPAMKIAPDRPALWAAGVLATVAGFGTTSESSSTKPPTMRSARVPFVTGAYCGSVYPFGAGIIANDGWYDPDTMVCAGYAQGGTDVCEGDSGGPILAPVRGALELVGTTSFGHGCAEPGYPTTYALAAAGPIRSFLEQYVPGAFAQPATAVEPVKKKPVKQQQRVYRDPGAWQVTVPAGWHVVSFHDSKHGIVSAGVQISSARLPKPAIVPGYPMQINNRVLPASSVGLVIATDSDPSPDVKPTRVLSPPLPAPGPSWNVGSALGGEPYLETLWFRVAGRTFIASIKVGAKSTRADARALAGIIRSLHG